MIIFSSYWTCVNLDSSTADRFRSVDKLNNSIMASSLYLLMYDSLSRNILTVPFSPAQSIVLLLKLSVLGHVRRETIILHRI